MSQRPALSLADCFSFPPQPSPLFVSLAASVHGCLDFCTVAPVSNVLNSAPKVGHKVKCNGKSELFSKNSSSTDARVREKYQFNLS